MTTDTTPDTTLAPLRIVILQRGWVVVGRWYRDDDQVTISDASVIRRWGTSNGLGELAAKGPLSDTILDPAGIVRTHQLAVIATIDCVESAWSR